MEPAAPASVPSSNAVRASPFPVTPKARLLIFGRMADPRSPRSSVLPTFRPSAKRAPRFNTPSADFCAAVRSPYGHRTPTSKTDASPQAAGFPPLCVPNIRFSMDAENRRGKFAT